MTERVPTRLELHRLSWDWRGRLLTYDELTADEYRLLSDDFLEEKKRTGDEAYVVLTRVLGAWGVMCSHGQMDAGDVECQLCGSTVLGRWSSLNRPDGSLGREKDVHAR